MSNLTPTMIEGLRKMEKNLNRQSATLAEPNENTGKALERRGLIERTDTMHGWNHYVLTETGRSFLAANPPTT